MSIETLVAIPKMERDEDLEAYTYPEEFRNKLYVFESQYIFFKTSSYDSMPKYIVDMVIDQVIEQKLEQFGKNETENSSMSDEMLRMLVSEIVSSHIEQINMPVQEIDETNVEKIVNSLFSVKYDQFMDGVNSRLEEFDNSFTEKIEACVKKDGFTQPASEGISREEISKFVSNIVLDHIDKIHKGLKPIVGNLLKEMIPSDFSCSPTPTQNSSFSKLSIGTLMALKEAGYSVEEIKQLRSEGLI